MLRPVIFAMILLFSGKAMATEYLFFGGENQDEFLGCINCEEKLEDSICNEFGAFGSEYSSKSMFNEFSSFGSEFSSKSPWNEFSNSNEVPVMVSRQGKFFGHLTINEFRSDAVIFSSELKGLLKSNGGDLNAVRESLCEGLKG